MKKLLASLLVLSMALAGCGGSSTATPEIALITDAGNINDKSFNQSAWEAVEQFVKDNGGSEEIGYKYYKPANFDTAGYSDSIDEAIENGAKTIVCPGFKFNDAVDAKQSEYPDVNFIFIDSTPTSGKIEKNVYCALYAEQESGYLAGYAAVKDGYTKLGFMGGMALPAVMRFGYGFVQGANDAAKELGVTVEIKYNYTGSFNESPEIKTLSSAWYNDGTEIIFACGGSICNSVFQAASEAGKYTIGVDSDQKDASPTVVTSAMKGVYNTVYNQLEKVYNGTFEGGKVETLTAAGNYVKLSDDFSRFNKFTKEEYDEVFKKVQNGEIKIKNDEEIGQDVSALSTDNVTIIDVNK